MFKFLGISFPFQNTSSHLWKYVIDKLEAKLSYWVTKHLSMVGKFQLCSKVLVFTHVYFSSYWTPSLACYKKLEILLRNFSRPILLTRMGFTRLLGIFIVCLNLLRNGPFFISSGKGFLYVPSGLFEPLMGLKLEKY